RYLWSSVERWVGASASKTTTAWVGLFGELIRAFLVNARKPKRAVTSYPARFRIRAGNPNSARSSICEPSMHATVRTILVMGAPMRGASHPGAPLSLGTGVRACEESSVAQKNDTQRTARVAASTFTARP